MEPGNTTSCMNSSGDSGGIPHGPPAYVEHLKIANQVVIAVTFSIVLFAMGASITPQNFKIVLRRPVGIAVGFVSQFAVMPLLAYCYALAVGFEQTIALGCLILACCPGGSLSNLYTFWTDGDLCLSIAMTTLSTLLAIGMMPLNLLIYSRRWTDQNTSMPYLDICISLILIVVPVGLGMVLRWKKSRWALLIAKPCSLIGFIGVVCSIIFVSIMNPRLYSSHWTIWLGAITLCWIGFALGYLLSFIFRQTHSQCRTIAFETGIQNVGLAFAIIAFSFAGNPNMVHMMTFPALFGPMSVVSGFACTAAYKLHQKFYGSDEMEDKPDGGGEEEERDGEKSKEVRMKEKEAEASKQGTV
ncbi:ileal sodium/bile acid cotransporter-like [Lytechinus pictus]|uniref:ileal sodium/bile acid cotransporter-like n=1 Tax=Lytechinus pictus TaxID=7653 RepID=UPI0030B9D93E